MDTIILESINKKRIISSNQKSSVIELENGDILKVYNAFYRESF